MNLKQKQEIESINRVIYLLKKGVSKPCPDEDIIARVIGIDSTAGCLTCRTYIVIKFLEEWIELI